MTRRNARRYVLLIAACRHNYYNGTPTPADLSEASSTLRPAQQSANFPSITIAGTLRTPYCFAFVAMSSLCMSRTSTSHDGQAMLRTSLIASSQAGQPALKISILRLIVMVSIYSS